MDGTSSPRGLPAPYRAIDLCLPSQSIKSRGASASTPGRTVVSQFAPYHGQARLPGAERSEQGQNSHHRTSDIRIASTTKPIAIRASLDRPPAASSSIVSLRHGRVPSQAPRRRSGRMLSPSTNTPTGGGPNGTRCLLHSGIPWGYPGRLARWITSSAR